MKWTLTLSFTLILVSCSTIPQNQPASTNVSPQANMPNPASVYCEEQGYKLEIRIDSDGGQIGVCVFLDGSECDEWAYYRNECAPASQNNVLPAESDEAVVPADGTVVPTERPTALPINVEMYQGWWTYTHPAYNFSIMLPEDWVVEEVTRDDPQMNGHALSIRPEDELGKENISMTFRRAGEEYPLWPSGVGQGEFFAEGTLDIAGHPAQRMLLVCPTGEVTSIWYQPGEGQSVIVRKGLEFGFIFSGSSHCEAGFSLDGKRQLTGEMIIASLEVP
jgi:putative hemolysin